MALAAIVFNALGYRKQEERKRIEQYLPVLEHWAEQTGFDVNELLALAHVETNFKDVGSNLSTAKGLLQITETGKKELSRLKVQLENDPETPEGRIEAGAKYLQLLRDHYGFTGDYLVAAYFAGPTYVNRYGLTDDVQNGQHSNREYVRRYLGALGKLNQATDPVRAQWTWGDRSLRDEDTPPLRFGAQVEDAFQKEHGYVPDPESLDERTVKDLRGFIDEYNPYLSPSTEAHLKDLLKKKVFTESWEGPLEVTSTVDPQPQGPAPVEDPAAPQEPQKEDSRRRLFAEVWGTPSAEASEGIVEEIPQSKKQAFVEIWEPPTPSTEQLTDNAPQTLYEKVHSWVDTPKEERKGIQKLILGIHDALSAVDEFTSPVMTPFAAGIVGDDPEEFREWLESTGMPTRRGPEWLETGSHLVGSVAGLFGLMGASSSAVTAARSVSWIGNAIEKGGQAINQALSKAPKLRSLASVGGTAAREAVEGTIFTALQHSLGQADLREDLGFNVLQFAGGGVGYRAARSVTQKYAPNASPAFSRAVELVGDNIGGVLASAGYYEGPEEMVDEMLSPQLIAIGLVDLVFTGMQTGSLRDHFRTRSAAERAREAYQQYVETGSQEALAETYREAETAWEAGLPDGASGDPRYAERVLEEAAEGPWRSELESGATQEATRLEDPIPMPEAVPEATPETPIAPEVPSPTEAPPTPEPTPTDKNAPENRRTVWRGEDGALVHVQFENNADALLYDLARMQAENVDSIVVNHAQVSLKDYLQLGEPFDIQKVSFEYRQKVLEEIKKGKDGETVTIPENVSPLPEEARQGPEVAAIPDETPVSYSAGEVRRSVFIGAHGRRSILFPSPVETALFDYHGISRRLIRDQPTNRKADIERLDALRSYLSKNLGIKPEEVNIRSKEFHEKVMAEARKAPEDGTVHIEPEAILRPEAPPREPEAVREVPKGEESVPKTPSRTPVDPKRVFDREPPTGEIRVVPRGIPEGTSKGSPFKPRPEHLTVEDFNRRMEEIRKWMVEYPGKTPPDELFRLKNEYRPADGYSINTTRYLAEGPVLETIKKISDVARDRKKVSHETIKRNVDKRFSQEAEKLTTELGLLQEEVSLLAAVLEKAPETITALRTAVVSNANALKELAHSISQGDTSDLTLAKFAAQTELQAALTASTTTLGERVARTLGAHKIHVGDKLIDVSEFNKIDWANDIMASAKVDAMVTAAGGRKALIDKAKIIVQAPDLAKVSEESRKMSLDKRWIRAIVEMRGAGLLRPVSTTVVNAVSQLFNQITTHSVNFTAAGIGAVFHRNDPKRLTFGEAKARFIGEMSGMIDAVVRPLVTVAEAGITTKAGKAPSTLDLLGMIIHSPRRLEEALRKTSLHPRTEVEGLPNAVASSEVLRETPAGQRISAIADALGRPFQWLIPNRTPVSDIVWGVFDHVASWQRLLGYGTLEITDRPFAYGGYHADIAGRLERMRQELPDTVEGKTREQYLAEIHEQVMTRRKEKLTGQKLLEGISEERYKLLDDIDETAMNNSKEMTWKDPIKSEFMADLEGFLRRQPVLRIFLPFYHTPVRILEKSFEMTPGVSMLSASTRADILGHNGRRAQELAYAKWAVGGLLYAIGAMLAASGLLTPTASSEAERRRMVEAGLPENSLKIGDKWININRLDPAPAIFFTTMANGAKVMRETDDEDTALQVGSSILIALTRSVLDKTWLTGISEALDAIMGIGSERYVESLINSTFIPLHGLRKDMAQFPLMGLNPFYNQHVMEANNLAERLMPKYPALDSFGKIRDNYSHIMGIRTGTETESPIRRELMNLGMTLPRPPRTVNGVELTDEQYWRMRRHLDTGLNAEDRLTRLVESSRYKRASREAKKELINDLWTSLMRSARDHIARDSEFKAQFRESQQRFVDRYREQGYEFQWFDN